MRNSTMINPMSAWWFDRKSLRRTHSTTWIPSTRTFLIDLTLLCCGRTSIDENRSIPLCGVVKYSGLLIDYPRISIHHFNLISRSSTGRTNYQHSPHYPWDVISQPNTAIIEFAFCRDGRNWTTRPRTCKEKIFIFLLLSKKNVKR